MLFLFLNKKNIEVKAIAELLFTDVSNDPWEVKNLTEEKLDFSIESIAIIDVYLQRLKKSTYLEKNQIRLSSRIGAYLGEVIRRKLSTVYHWYDFNVIFDKIIDLDEFYDIVYQQETLYSRRKRDYILPMYEVFMFFQNKSRYKNMSAYVLKMLISRNEK